MQDRKELFLAVGVVLLLIGSLGNYIDAVSLGADSQWFRLVLPVLCIPFAAMAWLFGTERQSARTVGLGIVILSLAEIGSVPDNALADVLSIVGSLGTGMWLWFCIIFPRDLPPSARASTKWAWLGAGLDGGVRLWNMVLGDAGGPSDTVVMSVDALVLLLACGILLQNYLQVSAVGRRRLRWLLGGIGVGACSWLVQVVIVLVAPSVDPELLYAATSLILVAMPIGALMGIFADDALAIDGRAKIVAALAVGLFLVAVASVIGIRWVLGPPLLELGLPPSVLVFATIVVATAALIAAFVVMRRRLVPAFLPERETFSMAPGILRREIAGLRSRTDLARGLARALETIFGTSWACAYVVAEGEVAIAYESEGDGADVEGAMMVAALQNGACPEGVVLDGEGGVALHLVADEELQIAIQLGPKRSHSGYTADERVFLSVVVSQAGASLEHMETSETVQRQRQIISSLRETSADATRELHDEFARANHDLGQPIQAIRLMGELLEDCELEPGAREIATSISLSVESMLGIVNSVSLANEAALEKYQFHLGELDGKLRALFEARALAKGLLLTIDLGEDHEVHSHPLLLERLLANLISNAIRYTDDGHVRVTHELDGDGSTVLCVADSGSGMDLDGPGDLFAPYTQLANGANEGQGLGMAIVARIAALLDHALTLESTGAGTTIRVRLSAP